jgi:hypothetical protein
MYNGGEILTRRSAGTDTLLSASMVWSTAARLASTLAMAGDVMSILRKSETSLTAVSIKDWVWYLEMVAGVSVVAKFKMCSVRNDAIYSTETLSITQEKDKCDSYAQEEVSSVREGSLP